MKGKLFGILTIAIVVAVVGYNLYTAQRNVILSDLALKNIEALAAGEGNGAAYKKCAQKISGLQGEPGLTHVTYCATCGPILSKDTKLNSTCN